MRVGIKPSALRETKWYQYAVRFMLGGLVTAMAGVVAKQFGPVVGGLFLAFPAIFPASVTLVEKHERQAKEKQGLNGKKRGRYVAGVDATGAALGSLGLAAFGGVVWWLAPLVTAWAMLAGATLVWVLVSVMVWTLFKRIHR